MNDHIKHAANFDRDVIVTKENDGWFAGCRLGLWSLYCYPSEQAVRNAAMHYYIQYASDGEYDDEPKRLVIK